MINYDLAHSCFAIVNQKKRGVPVRKTKFEHRSDLESGVIVARQQMVTEMRGARSSS